ncbi:unnamed protein product, partial [Aphanomyces euteiches]
MSDEISIENTLDYENSNNDSMPVLYQASLNGRIDLVKDILRDGGTVFVADE